MLNLFFFQDVSLTEFEQVVQHYYAQTMSRTRQGYTAPNTNSVKCMPLLQIQILHTNPTIGLILDKVA